MHVEQLEIEELHNKHLKLRLILPYIYTCFLIFNSAEKKCLKIIFIKMLNKITILVKSTIIYAFLLCIFQE